jgi:hypothetical protein
MEAMWNQAIATLAMAFSYYVGQMASLFRDYLDNQRQLRPVKELCTS